MKKVIRLTESDLIRLVKRVIKEQSTAPTAPAGQTPEQNDKALRKLLTDNGFTIPQGTDNRIFTKFKGEEEFILIFSKPVEKAKGDKDNSISLMVNDPSEATITNFKLEKLRSNDDDNTYVPKYDGTYSYELTSRGDATTLLKDTEAYNNVKRIINYTK